MRRLEVLGVGTTGYAKDILKDVLTADVALVETVAHTESAMKFYKDPHVIVDVGGQDIKLIILKDGRVKDFKLNTQCSAGNGYFLQSHGGEIRLQGRGLCRHRVLRRHHAGLRLWLRRVHAVRHRQLPAPGMARRRDSRRIGEGSAEEHFSVRRRAFRTSLSSGSRFILQGGTQNNLAAVKSEVDFIRSTSARLGQEPEVIVHEHCGESGAIGAAIEAIRLCRNGHRNHVHRLGRRAEDQLPDYAQRRHALLLLQE